jgi:tRNA A37 N6-isopentenylltransferase MiaA
VRRVLGMGYAPTLSTLQSVGYREVAAYLGGAGDLAQTRELIERHTWRLAKRQMTWFRRMSAVHWISLTEMPVSAAIELIHRLLASARGSVQDALPDSREEAQGTGCACPVLR